MSQADYSAKQSQFLAIAPDAIRKPNLPIRIFLQEAENLHQWCQLDKPVLTAANFDWAIVDDLPLRIGALREAESRWFRERFSHEQAQQQWELESPNAYGLRDQLLRAMRYAFRRDDALLKRVANIAAGAGHADMIQDLNDIAALGRDFAGLLLAVNVDLAELDRAAMTAATMAVLLAQANGERADNSSARVVRDQAYTLLKNAVDELRACGQYALWNNAVRREGYFSGYQRAVRRSSATSSGEPATEASATPA